jgi:hypothetical protein
MVLVTVGVGDVRLPERFWEKVVVNNDTGCWEWTACRVKTGYGRVGWGGQTRFAHRVAYTALVGEFDERCVVLHLCDNPPCVNPGHLKLGSQSDNMRDMYEKGRNWQSAKTDCMRGHRLEEPNLVLSGVARGKRNCLSCTRALSRVRHNPALDLQTESDLIYSSIWTSITGPCTCKRGKK